MSQGTTRLCHINKRASSVPSEHIVYSNVNKIQESVPAEHIVYSNVNIISFRSRGTSGDIIISIIK